MYESLVLNRYGVPIEIIGWEKAISRIYCEAIAFPIAEYEKSISSPNISVLLPSVIQMIYSNHQPKKFTNVLPFNRKNVYMRDRGICMYCKRKVSISNFTIDHVVPQSMGGQTEWDNVVVCCIKCNSKKGCKPLKLSGLKLIRDPYIPKLNKAAPLNLVSKIGLNIQHESWSDYIYWVISSGCNI